MAVENEPKTQQSREALKAAVDTLIREGYGVGIACRKAGVRYSTYKFWGGEGLKAREKAGSRSNGTGQPVATPKDRSSSLDDPSGRDAARSGEAA